MDAQKNHQHFDARTLLRVAAFCIFGTLTVLGPFDSWAVFVAGLTGMILADVSVSLAKIANK